MCLIFWPRCGNISDGFWSLLDSFTGSHDTWNGPVSASPAASRVSLSHRASAGSARAHVHPVPPVDGASSGRRPWPALPLPGVASFPPSTGLFPSARISLLFQGRLFHRCDCVSPSRELRLPSQLELDLLVNIPLVIVCLSYIIPCYWDRVCFCWLSYLNCYNFWYTMIGSAKYLLSRIAYLRLEIKCKNLFFTTILNCIGNSFIFLFSLMPVVLILQQYYFKNKHSLSSLIIAVLFYHQTFLLCSGRDHI